MKHDYLIIGAGIIGLTVALEILKNQPDAKVLILEKEDDVARHASGRNSGVLHAGFYYSADTFKAKFTVAGNLAMKEYCRANGLPINTCGKLVVAQDDVQVSQLQELFVRGSANGSNVRLVSPDEARALEPNIRTYKQALYSPDTATIDPEAVCRSLKRDVMNRGADLFFRTAYLERREDAVLTSQGDFSAGKVINCSGLYADAVARDFGFAQKYTMMPFKGIYLNYTKNDSDIKMNIYPVPDLRNPFLGVHFTKAVDGHIKIGPTAIPAFGRENYQGLGGVNILETPEIVFWQGALFLLNAFHFRDLAVEEIRKYDKRYFIGLAQKMVEAIDPEGFTEYTRPGIRAQLLNKRTRELVQDFVVEGDTKSIHVLNAVSPAFTCAFPFAEFVYKNYIRN